ncbi:hypothetical protein MA16_Dca028009 [Dendrobium catenatum]|uniref:Pectin acetylesterase n=1 Tax=Dendrobium catenatum TaxID=906689 RepID=A0A2I0VDN1_9ASPA|nr:hypothetical protein MA16_Dca028009 [Dendrobium catenatum]
MLPDSTIVKCMSDAGFFLDVNDITGNDTIRTFFNSVVKLQVSFCLPFKLQI